MFRLRDINFNRAHIVMFTLLMAVIGLFSFAQMSSAATDLDPGEVRVSKTAKAVDGKINTWDIELTIEARNSQKTSDIVLVMDRSGSMSSAGSGGKSKLQNAKDAANSFIDTVLTPPGNTTNRIALVSFADNVTQNSGFVSTPTTLKSAVNSLNANGGTYTQLAINRAQQLIATSVADNKTIVLLSDGQPTYSTALYNPDNYLIAYPGNGWQTSADAPQSAYNYSTRVGTGSSMYWRYYNDWWDSNDKYYNHGNSTIAEAGFAKNAGTGTNIYTIALSAGTEGNAVLNAVASPGKAYTASASDLQTIFNEIAGLISAGATNINITDVVAPQFKITNSGGGTVSGNTVDWTNVQLGVADANGVRKATETIRIELADDFAGTDNQYPTNTSVNFNYKDTDGKTQNKSVASPIVNPVLIRTEKVVDGNKAAASDSFAVTVNDSVSANFGAVFTDSGNVVSNKGRETGNYAISETIAGGHYGVTYEYRVGAGSYQAGTAFSLANKYQTNTDGVNADNDIYVRVTNKAKLGKLTVQKKLGECNLNTPANPASGTAFVFEVKNASGEVVRTVTLHVTKDGCFSSETIADLPQGVYTVTEQGAEDYTTTFMVSGDVTVHTGKVADVTVGLASDLARTVTFTNVFTKNRTITVNKTWEGGKTSDWTATFELWRDGAKLTGEDKTITGNGSASWTVPEADIYGTPYAYAVKEIAPTNYTPTLNCTTGPCAVDSNGNLSIKNAYESPKTTFTAKKVWAGGPVEHPTIQFQLFRDGVAFGDPVDLPSGTTEYTWTNLDATDNEGNAYTYTVDEVAVPVNYQKTQQGNTITNKYIPPKGPIKATKVWKGGDANNRPTIEFQLFRQIGDGTAEAVPGAEIKTLAGSVTEVTWDGIELTDGNGVAYTFSVVELTNLADYEKDEQGLTVTNTYQIPTRNITVKKEWKDGASLVAPVKVELKQDGTVIDTVTLSEVNSWTHTWEELEVTDFYGHVYTYSLNEKDVPNSFVSYVGDEDENGQIIITNVYNIPEDGEATATKIWVNGPTPRPDIRFQLYRQIGDGAPEAVPGAEIKTLSDGTITVTWTGLERTDSNGVAYTFSVRELNAPANYEQTHDGLTVTNAYVIPTNGEFTAYKVWDGGPSPRPTIWFQLWRTIGGEHGTYEAVPDAPIQELADGTLSVSWTGLEETDINGNPYLFYVKETNAEGVELVPANYTADISPDGTTITNTYVSPKITYTVEKIWRNSAAPYPTIQIQLYRNGEAYGQPITLASGITKYTWINLDKTDKFGEEYTYSVDEVVIPAGYIKHIDGNRIVNTKKDDGQVISATTGGRGALAYTGSNNLLVLMVAGMILLLSGTTLISRRQQ